jgi:exodeoxyribonuclease V alpha subunit
MSAGIRGWPRPPQEGLLESARSFGILSALDHQFAKRLSALYEERTPGIRWALAIASRQEAAGHVCADLGRLATEGLIAESGGETVLFSALAANDSVADWIAEIRQSALVETISPSPRDASNPRPLVLDEKDRLYLRRSYESQLDLAALVRSRSDRPDLSMDRAIVRAGLTRFVDQSSTQADESAEAALTTALSRPLAIVTGGPGTGKTTLVARLVALLIEEAIAKGESPPRVRLLAPTGKAAAAMTGAFTRQRESLDLSADVRQEMDVTAETIHRALFAQTRSDAFGRPRSISLAADVVVVDEASMVDLELMARLFAACDSVERLVLLGDPDQLASVDSGAVLAELCARPISSGAPTGLATSISILTTSHRFSESGGIGRLATAIRAGDADAVVGLLDDDSLPEIERFEIDSIDAVRTRLIEASRHVQSEIEGASEPGQKLDRLGLYRVLCAHRRGPLGVEAICSILDETAAAARHTTRHSGWWLGRMLLVTQNAPDQDLWNGDVGLIEETPLGLRAFFPDGLGGVRALSAGRLPAHESAIAMSVHKSQGSEFDLVDLVLGRVTSRLMTRELLYTGVTRARSRLRIHASEAVLRQAVERRVARDSGLAELLWTN